ncbi:hypothetical protein GCM10008013_22990 [Paenibacillus segetis]|uniref:Uncharacterized protein n=1 Tax=Paenibacillus segetis TaxID=1325360 RepID=A0ABQ1YF03_9BACL|nr:hypothetical protein GCM10008013_22990 [Paenibacillus segetis]
MLGLNDWHAAFPPQILNDNQKYYYYTLSSINCTDNRIRAQDNEIHTTNQFIKNSSPELKT